MLMHGVNGKTAWKFEFCADKKRGRSDLGCERVGRRVAIGVHPGGRE